MGVDVWLNLQSAAWAWIYGVDLRVRCAASTESERESQEESGLAEGESKH